MSESTSSDKGTSKAPHPEEKGVTSEATQSASADACTGPGAPTPAEDEDSVSMLDVLEDEVQMEQDAHAVLGGSDPTHCTYTLGYVDRQALYSCSTCTTHDDQPAGICLACSLECHEGHNLYELYTKRNFRCDCGNKKFVDSKCKLNPTEKSELNPDNVYSQNFQGLYCVCNRPYPDMEDETDDEMLQCSVCEDWYHGRHLGVELPDEDFDELVCLSCMKKMEFLYYYCGLFPALQGSASKIKATSHTEEVDVTKVTEEDSLVAKETADNDKNPISKSDIDDDKSKTLSKTTTAENLESEKVETDQNVEPSEKMTESSSSVSEESVKTLESDKNCDGNNKNEGIDNKGSNSLSEAKCDKDVHKENSDDTKESQISLLSSASDNKSEEIAECKLKQLEKCCQFVTRDGATFWPDGWRKKLCVCAPCKKMYSDLGVTFLTRTEDTIKAYEARGKESAAPMTRYEKGMRALQTMDRTQQVEVLTEYNTMKDELTDYLKKFAENKKMVREEDIKEFFQGLASKKRQRTEIPHFCK